MLYIHPQKRAPDGSVTKALQELSMLRKEVTDNSVVSGLTHWLDSTFGKWKNVILSLVTTVLVVFACFVFCGCCLIPCIRSLIAQKVDRSIAQQMIKNNLLCQGDDPDSAVHSPIDSDSEDGTSM